MGYSVDIIECVPNPSKLPKLEAITCSGRSKRYLVLVNITFAKKSLAKKKL